MRNTVILILILALCAGVFFLVKRKGGKSLSEAADFSVPDTGSITSVEISHVLNNETQSKLLLERLDSGSWRLNGKFDVQPGKIHALLEVVRSLEVKEKLKEAGIESAIAIMKRTHTRVKISGRNGEIKTYLIGPTNPDQTGNVMLLEGEETPFIMARPGGRQGYLYIYYSPEIDDWRDNILFEADSSNLLYAAVRYPGADSSFEIRRKSPQDEWTLSGDKANEQAIHEYVSGFNGKVRAESFAGKKYPGMLDSLKRRMPDFVLQVGTSARPKTVIRMYRRDENPENYFAWVEGQEELLTLQYFVMGKFLRKRAFFMPRPL